MKKLILLFLFISFQCFSQISTSKYSSSKNIIVFEEQHKKETFGNLTRYTFTNNDPFEVKKKPIVIIKGKIIGKSKILSEAPDLFIELGGSMKNKYFFHFRDLNEIKEFIGDTKKWLDDGAKFYGTRLSRITAKVMDFKGEQILSNEYSLASKDLLYTYDSQFEGAFYNKENPQKVYLKRLKIGLDTSLDLTTDALKKGHKLLMKINSAKKGPHFRTPDGSWTSDSGPIIEDFDDFYFEYSLIGSSEALVN